MPPKKDLARHDEIATILPIDDVVSPTQRLQELQVVRRFCIVSQSRCNRSIEAFMARLQGYHTDLPEAERARIFKMAAMARVAIEKAVDLDGDLDLDAEIFRQQPGLRKLASLVILSKRSRQGWDLHLATTAKEMETTAKGLAVYPWVKEQRGFSALGLAVIIGETGDLSNYSGPGKVWKRLGLGCINGVRQNFIPAEITGDARKEEWAARGYNPVRRSQVWAFIDDILVRPQWNAAKDEDGNDPKKSKKPIAVEAHAAGPYGKVYGERKAWNLARGLTPGHADKDARRFMAKRFIRDLWCAWQEAVGQPALAEAAE